MFNGDGAMPIELVEIEPKGVLAYDRAGVNTGQTEDESLAKLKL